jgi:long-chain fatty acid transport protein
MRRFVMTAAALLAGGPALGSGYSVYEQGAKASAQAGAFAARADDPSAIFYNPAGLTELRGWQVMIGTSAIGLGDTRFESPSLGDDDMIDNTLFPSHLYLTHRAGGRISWGIGLYTPFGLETEWDGSSPLRFSSLHAELRTAYLNPVIAIRISDAWSVAAGVSYVRGEVRAFSRDVSLTPLAPLTSPTTFGQEVFANLRGDDDDVTFNLGLQWRAETGLFAGLTYRGSATLDIRDGEVVYSGVPGSAILTEPGVTVQDKFVDGPAAAVIPLPDGAALGLGYHGDDPWSVEFDLVWTDWSDFQELVIDLANTSTVNVTGLPQGPFAPVVQDQTIRQDWIDTFSWRLGFGWAFTGRHEICAGLYFDENPIPDDTVRPSLPDADRWSAQVGYGFAAGAFQLDVYYQYLDFEGREAVPSGTPTALDPCPEGVCPGGYDTHIDILGVSGVFRF